jgi:hypothetical protein
MCVNNAAIEEHVLNVIFALVAFYVLLKYFVNANKVYKTTASFFPSLALGSF